MQRISYIDTMRGIGITLVILQHCIGSVEEELSRFILTFHMPLFFFISGLCFKGGGGNLIVRKARTILIPQVTLCVISLITIILLDVFLSKRSSLTDVNLISLFLNMWFLPTLFCMELIIIPILQFIKNRLLILIISIGVILLFCITDYSQYHIVQQTLCALIFGLIGFLLRPYFDRYTQSNFYFKGWGWLSILLVAFLSVYNEPICIFVNQYGNKLFFITIALIGIMSIADLSLQIRNSDFLEWLGKNSIYVYVIQFMITRIVVAVFCRIMHSSGYPYYFISFFASLFLCACFVPLLNKYTPYLFGKFSK